MIEKFDIITLEDNKNYSVVEIFKIDNQNYLLLVEILDNDELNYNNIKVLKQSGKDLIKIENYDELKKIENAIKPFLEMNK